MYLTCTKFHDTSLESTVALDNNKHWTLKSAPVSQREPALVQVRGCMHMCNSCMQGAWQDGTLDHVQQAVTCANIIQLSR